jgi:hypothetical protein
MGLSLPVVALVLLTKAELLAAMFVILFYFVDSLRPMTLSNTWHILGNRNVQFHLGVVLVCVVYWVVLDLFDSSMPFRLVPWILV